jgi:hypothetical protein
MTRVNFFFFSVLTALFRSLATELEQILYPEVAFSDIVGAKPRVMTSEERQKEIQGAFFKAVAEIFDGIDFSSEVMELKQQIGSKNTVSLEVFFDPIEKATFSTLCPVG